MNLLIFAENERIRRSIEEYFKSTPHKLQGVDLSTISSMKDLSPYHAMVTDQKSWQENAAILRYFGLLTQINHLPLMVFRESGKQQKLKFREIGHQTVVCNFSLSTEEVQSFLDQLLETQEIKN